jgi:hypothetical protein
VLASGDLGEQLRRWGDAERAEEGRRRDPHPGQVRGYRVAVGELPAHQERFREPLAQEPEAWDLPGVAPRGRGALEDLDGEHVAGLGAVDGDRAGERVHPVQAHAHELLRPAPGIELSVDGIERVEDDLVLGLHVQDWRYVGMPTVVAPVGLRGERLGKVEPDLSGGHLIHPHSGGVTVPESRYSRVSGRPPCCGR